MDSNMMYIFSTIAIIVVALAPIATNYLDKEHRIKALKIELEYHQKLKTCIEIYNQFLNCTIGNPTDDDIENIKYLFVTSYFMCDNYTYLKISHIVNLLNDNKNLTQEFKDELEKLSILFKKDFEI